jgi:GAF domain-containing protein
MQYHTDNTDDVVHRNLTRKDPEAPQRMRRLAELDLGSKPDPEFDRFARKIAHDTGAPYAMVNFVGDQQQYFAGLYAESDTEPSAALEAGGTSSSSTPGRVMSLDHGYCPEVVVRRLALPLPDVYAMARFAGNPVVDKLHIRSYLGAPLIDHTGTCLGTICAVDTAQHPTWRETGLATIKTLAKEMVALIEQRERRQ